MELKDYIRDVADFPKKGISFKDISPMLKEPRVLRKAVKRIGSEWAGEIDAIAALDARGFIFGGMLAFDMDLPLVMLRKIGKLPGVTIQVSYDLEYGSAILEAGVDAFSKDSRVLVTDDLLATGGTANAACRLVEACGAKVAGCAFVVELEALEGRKILAGRRIQSLVTC
jgi:adenine phosphoribosyltransferase